MKQTGWRKPTPGLGIAEQHAQAGERAGVPKTRAFVAVKRVGASIGLKAGDMLLLDTLGAFTRAQDWETGQRPIVWASNAYLMEQTGFSLSALKRHARRLAEIGVISFKDSPNGKRWGHRDPDGRIVEAYGFDLSPLSARAEEFEALNADLQAERALCQRLKRQITVTRRMIRARIEAALADALHGPWEQLSGLFHELLKRLPRKHTNSDRLARILSLFHDLRETIETNYLRALPTPSPVDKTGTPKEENNAKTRKLPPKGSISEPHIPVTNKLELVIGNTDEPGQTQPVTPMSASPADALENKSSETSKQRADLDLPTVTQACPEFTSWARNLGGFLKDWSDLHRAAGQLRPMIGISDHTWNVAQQRLGKHLATAALALVFEKHCTGEVMSPGSYLRGMVKKARTGELHLERSFHGRLSRHAA